MILDPIYYLLIIETLCSIVISQDEFEDIPDGSLEINLPSEPTCDCPDFGATIGRYVLKEGFHRDLVTTLKLYLSDPDDNLLKRPYRVLIREKLSSAMYVDPYDYTSLKKGSPHKVRPEKVDIEKPAHEGQPQEVLIYIDTRPNMVVFDREKKFHVLNINVSVPVHLRYRVPNQNSERDDCYVDGACVIVLADPEVYITAHPLVEQDYAPEACEGWVPLSCDVMHKDTCMWKKLTLFNKLDPVILYVPVGKTVSTYIVIPATIIILIVSMGYLGWSLFKRHPDLTLNVFERFQAPKAHVR